MADQPAGAPVLVLEGVSKQFGALPVLRDVQLTVPAGASVAVLGPSGSGKSTLLHLAGLMEAPSAGVVRIDGRSVGALSDAERSRLRLHTVGFLFQFHYLLPGLTLLENALIPARLAGDDIPPATRAAREILDRLGLSERLGHRPAELSGGEQQRGALARALLRRPRLLLCDEPTGNLDQTTAVAVMAVIFEEIARNGAAAVIVTHNRQLARRAGTSYHLSDGQLEPVRNEAIS